MTRFKALGPIKKGCEKLDVKNNKVKLNNKGTTFFSFNRAAVEIMTDQGQSRTYVSQRGVIEAPDAALVLPYFQDKGEWYVVLIEQFRLALSGQTLEAPGGELDTADVARGMVRELQEETGISVAPKRIKVVYSELAAPSLMSAKMWGGIVKLEKSEVPEALLAGEWACNEYSALATRPLVAFLKSRDAMTIIIDLWLSRLLDEVAKKVGPHIKKY